jgi:uncharacterized protein YukE
MNKAHFFIDESGVLRVITDMPEEPSRMNTIMTDVSLVQKHADDMAKYQSALKAAKKQAIEVDNKLDVVNALFNTKAGEWFENSRQFWHDMKSDQIYSLECNVVIDERPWYAASHLQGYQKVALITFSESKPMNEEKKTAEDYFKERFDLVYWDDKFDRKCQRFDFYDMVDFADQYASQFKSVPPLPVEDKELKAEVIHVQWCNDGMYRVSKPRWDGGNVVTLVDYEALRMKYIELKDSTRKQLE